MRLSPKSAVFSSSSRLAVVAVLGAAVAGCSSDFSRTVEGPYSGTTSNQQSIIGGQPAAPALRLARAAPD